jgi:hypothetical protein
LRSPVLLFDAAGLGLFAVVGRQDPNWLHVRSLLSSLGDAHHHTDARANKPMVLVRHRHPLSIQRLYAFGCPQLELNLSTVSGYREIITGLLNRSRDAT